MDKDLLVAEEIAELFRVNKQRVYQMVRDKSLPFILLGQRQYRFSKKAVEAWLENGGTQKDGESDDSK